MDSLTQIALGSAVAVAVMGRRTAVWKAALWGGVAGTLPDLDAFIDHGDAVLNMVRHRAESHSLIYLTLFSPLLAWGVSRLHRDETGWQGGSDPRSGGAWGPRFAAGPPQGETAPSGGSDPRSGGAWGPFLHWWLALWLVLVTHPLLDTMTVYGTQLLNPFTEHPFGVGSVFIIDPAYTLPLLVGVIAALALRHEGRGLRWNMAGLLLSTAYLGWSVVAQQVVTQVARDALHQQGVASERLLVTPTPFNTVLWRLVAVTPTHYHEGYYSLLDDRTTVRWLSHDRGPELIARHGGAEPVDRIARFSHGFYRLRATPEQRLQVTDLRMGQDPDYVFNFDVGPVDAIGSVPASHRSSRPDTTAALAWLWQRARGADLLPMGAALAAPQ